uniref:ATP synthase F0 subunit b n=1 Tax=Gracilaria flabelliformis TaxID=172955 RepID=UPI001D10EF28|nr:ATP synthase F0 subunit b [Gracilaria flabelliformis]UAD89674.1 ATP synthase F0 subunit b [Gracilaria flabelliformis]
MLNFSIVVILSLILISKNLILLNEETLILLCFITFCWLGFTKLKDSLYADFESQKKEIETKFSESFKSIVSSLIVNLKWQKLFPILVANFGILEKQFTTLSFKMIGQVPAIQNKELQKTYLKKLFFTKRLEEQTSKVISLVLVKKIEKITFLKYFYSTKVKIATFQCNYKIALREYIETI